MTPPRRSPVGPFGRRALAAAVGLLTAAAAAGTAVAHGGAVGADREPLAVPAWLFLATGGAVVGASFLLASTVTDRRFVRAVDGWRYHLGGRRVLSALARVAPVVGGLAVLGVVVAGAVGTADPIRNPAVLVVWVGWWAGYVATAYLLGDSWPALDPFRALARRLRGLAPLRRLRTDGSGGGAEGRSAAADPDADAPGVVGRYGAWPAVVGLLALVYVEVVAPVSSDPRALAALVAGYGLVTVAGGVLVGPAWFRSVDPVSKVFGYYGRVAPLAVEAGGPADRGTADADGGTAVEDGRRAEGDARTGDGDAAAGERRADGGAVLGPDGSAGPDAESEGRPARGPTTGDGAADDADAGTGAGSGAPGGLALRLPGAGLTAPGGVDGPDEVAFVVGVVWVTTYDGLVTTPAWAGAVRAVVGSVAAGVPVGPGTVGAVVYALALAGGYAAVLGAYRLAARLSVRVTDTYLTPGTLARGFAPSLLAIAAGYHLAHFAGYFLSLSPLLAGALGLPVGPAPDPVVVPAWVGGLELGAVLAGHLLAVWVAHAAAFRLFPGRLQAVRSQYPFVAVMVAYTMASLWIVAEPTVAAPYAA